MTIDDFFLKHNCTESEKKSLISYYFAMRIDDLLPIWNVMMKKLPMYFKNTENENGGKNDASNDGKPM